jgi:hypothetical protein
LGEQLSGRNEIKKDSRNLRLRLGITIAALAVIAVSISIVMVASVASSHLSKKTERQLYTTYVLASPEIGPIGTDPKTNRTKPPQLGTNTVDSLDQLCQGLHLNLAYLPGFEVSRISLPTTGSISVDGTENTAVQSAKYTFGYQSGASVDQLVTDPNV